MRNSMYKKYHYSNQHGMATLAVTVILLFVMTLVTLYVAKTSIKEQQISANQYRADQSLATANAALDWGIAYYSEAGGFACDERLVGVLTNYFDACPPSAADNKATLCTIYDDDDQKCKFDYTKSAPLEIGPGRTDDALSIGASEMYFAFVDAGGNELDHIPVKTGSDGVTSVVGENVPVYAAEIKIVGVGHSDDDTAMRTVSLDIKSSNIAGEPGLGASAFPLISKSTGSFAGNATIINRFDNRTIWSGNEFDISGSTNTYILKEGMGWNCNDINYHDECVKDIDPPSGGNDTVISASDGQDLVNADIIDGDPNLGNFTADDFFENFFGKTKKEMIQAVKDVGLYVVFNGSGLIDKNGISYTWGDLADYTPLVWIDAASEYAPSGGDLTQIGTEVDPMVLIVDGDLEIRGTGSTDRVLVGALYVTGIWDATANPVIQGMVIVEGESDVGGTGSATVIYDADLFSGKMGPPPGTIAAPAPATWKDW